jgi:protein phosphatase
MTQQIRFAAQSHTGLVRENNEDSYEIVAFPGDYPLAMILADGMGGHSKGEIASEIAVEFVAGYLREALQNQLTPPELTRLLQELVKKANVKVYLSSLESEENHGMGTTLTALVILEDRLLIAHVGDCRVYLFRSGQLQQLTVDHTLVQEMVDAGSLTAEETWTHPRRNVLTRALGFPDFVTPDTPEFMLAPGDRIVLCSDGLHGYVPPSEIARIIQTAAGPQAIVDNLVQAALTAGGEDNVTVLAAILPDRAGEEAEA